jgi:hypothetical protein
MNGSLSVLPPGRIWPRPRVLMVVALLVQALLWVAALGITGGLR